MFRPRYQSTPSPKAKGGKEKKKKTLRLITYLLRTLLVKRYAILMRSTCFDARAITSSGLVPISRTCILTPMLAAEHTQQNGLTHHSRYCVPSHNIHEYMQPRFVTTILLARRGSQVHVYRPHTIYSLPRLHLIRLTSNHGTELACALQCSSNPRSITLSQLQNYTM